MRWYRAPHDPSAVDDETDDRTASRQVKYTALNGTSRRTMGAGVDWAMILDGHAASSLMIERGGGGMIVRGTLFILCPA